MIVWTGIVKFVRVLYSFATYTDIACIAHAEMQLHSRRLLIQYYQTQTSGLSCRATSCAVDISSHAVRQIPDGVAAGSDGVLIILFMRVQLGSHGSILNDAYGRDAKILWCFGLQKGKQLEREVTTHKRYNPHY